MHTLSSTTVLLDSRPLTSTTMNTLALPPPLFAMKATVATLPTELLPNIFEFAACCDEGSPPGEPSQYMLQLVSRVVRKWTHPFLYAQLRIFSVSRMVAFVETFDTPRAECMALLAQSVRDLNFLNDRTDSAFILGAPGRLGRVIDVNAYLVRMLELCKSLKRFSVNYIKEGLNVPADGARPQELTVLRARLYKIDKSLTSTLFENVTKLHFRRGQLALYILEKLPLHRLTHMCFRQYFSAVRCDKFVSMLLEKKNIERVIVEVPYGRMNPNTYVKKALAEKWPQEDRLIVRSCRYELSMYELEVFKDGEDVWDVDRDLQWRETECHLE